MHTVEKISSISRKVNVTVPADKVESAVQSKLKEVAKTVKMQGFRPGKVPMRVVEQQYRGSATQEVMGDLVQETLYEALNSEEITPAVQPDVEPQPIKKGEDFSYSATFDVYPEFSKLDLDGIEVIEPSGELDDKVLETVIENMRKQQISWNDVKRKSKKGDRAIIDFSGTIDGEDFGGGAGEDHPLVLGEGRMLKDFEDGIVGMKAGEVKDVDVVFPDDYQAEELQGKTAVFKIEVKSVSESVLPEVDEEFIKGFGVESGKLEDLHEQVKGNLQTNLDSQIGNRKRQNTFDALLEQNEVEVPMKMVQEEIKRMVEQQMNQFQMQGIDPSMLPEPNTEIMEPEAKKRVALGLLMMEVVRKNELKPDEAKVKERIETMASSYEDPSEFVNYYMSNQQALAQVQSIVLEEKVVDHLLATANVKVEKVDASELLNMG